MSTPSLLPLAAAFALALSSCRDAAPEAHPQAPVSMGETPIPPAQPAAAPTASAIAASPLARIRYIVGGDSRQDVAHVVPWAFHEAKARDVAAFVFLGDMEIKPALDDHFRAALGDLAPIPFFPVLGNHECVKRALGADVPREDKVRALSAYRARFLGTPGTPVQSAFDDKLVYAVDLAGGVHFVALDNVTQPGFGKEQLAWLAADLERARKAPGGAAAHVVIGMHKALAGSGITTHAMDEDGPGALADSAAALALFEQAHVEIIFASHFHSFAEYAQHGIRSFITGGMGAPLDVAPGDAGLEHPFHHVLVVGVPASAPLTVEVLRFPGAPSVGVEDER
jgi:3',5'-cyclic AMP phosphodiesterase CpdA